MRLNIPLMMGLLLFMFNSSNDLFAQQKFTISGYIEDGANGEKLIAANVFDSKTASGAVTNTYGFYSLTLPQDSVSLIFSYIGYPPQEHRFYLDKDIKLNIRLSSSVELETIEIVAEKYEKIEEKSQMSQVEVPIETIKKLPALLGEVDVLKTLQLLPGVQSGGEGQTGLYVRGGSPDQNLILLDGVPVYNVSHVLGIFSVFNADAIKNVTLTKGGFPARYGGRLSSVLEINMNEGNLEKFQGEGSLGLISSKLTLQGPIKKGKTSFLISGRRTYIDILANPIIKAAAKEDGVQVKPKLFFYDMNAKIQHKFNDKHRLFLSAYSGADVFKVKVKEDSESSFEGGVDWGNLISAARWNYQISNKLFANTTLTYSQYDINILAAQEFVEEDVTESYSANYFSGIEDIGGKIDLDYIPNPNHYIRFGASATNHTYSPGALSIKANLAEVEFDTLVGSQDARSMEYGLYVEDDMKIGALKANVGVHASAFTTEGKTYYSVQPRLGLRYLMPNEVALKASFSTMTQYINLLTSEALSLPTDLWVPSTERIVPQESWQVAAGAARTFLGEYEISLEAYYKQMKNVISFKEGANFLFGLENSWQDKVTQGDGESYGLEVFLQKKKGKTTGWIGYTLSWNWRQFDEINGGERFPFRYDRRHDISVVVSHDFNERISVSGAWVYGTGNAITLPLYRYPTNIDSYSYQDPVTGQTITETYSQEIKTGSEKNSFRMSDYHRLDLSAEFKKKKKKWERAWVISVYNTYFNRNPYFVISDTERIRDANGNVVGRKQVFKEISILPIIPSVSYNFKF